MTSAAAAAIAGVATDLDLPEPGPAKFASSWLARAEAAFGAQRYEEANAAARIARAWQAKAELAHVVEMQQQFDQEDNRQVLEFTNTDGAVVAAAIIGDEGIVARRYPLPGGHYLEFPAHLTVQQAKALLAAYEEITGAGGSS